MIFPPRGSEIAAGRDGTGQVAPEELCTAGLEVTDAAADLRRARDLIAAWRDDYNHHRLHTTFDELTPRGIVTSGQ